MLTASVSTLTIGLQYRGIDLVALDTPRTLIRLLDPSLAAAMQRYYDINAAHLDPWEPLRASEYNTIESWRRRGRIARKQAKESQALRLVAVDKTSGDIAAICNFTNIQYGPLQACTLGYSVARAHEGKGLMFEVAECAIAYVFSEFHLHRIIANYIPENTRSARLLERLGFEKEGLAKSYLQIAGEWRDHVLTAKINPAFKARPS